MSFEDLVAEAVADLPDALRAQLNNVEIFLADEPTPEQAQGVGGDLFGLYEGIPQTERGSDYTFTLPDRITIFQGPLERAFPSPDELHHQVQVTVVHEIAHHFGITESRLAELGWD